MFKKDELQNVKIYESLIPISSLLGLFKTKTKLIYFYMTVEEKGYIIARITIHNNIMKIYYSLFVTLGSASLALPTTAKFFSSVSFIVFRMSAFFC